MNAPAHDTPAQRRDGRLILAGFWAASILLTYLVASSRNPATQVASETSEPSLPSDAETPAIEYRRRAMGKTKSADETPFPMDAFDQPTSEIPLLRNEEIRQYLGFALQSDDLVLRKSIVGNMLSRLAPDNLGEVLRTFESSPPSFHTDNDYRLFLHAWAKLDGAAALDYIRHHPDARRVEHGATWAMSGWAQADTEAAFDYVYGEENLDHGLYYGLVRGWARVDLAEANAHVQSMEKGGLRRRMVDVLAESYLEQHGVQGTLDWAATAAAISEDGGFARAALEDTVKRAATRDANAVADWINDNADTPHLKPWMFEHTAGNLADRDPWLAATWVRSHADDERVTARTVSRVVDEWATRDPAATAEWVDHLNQPDLLNEGVAYQLAGTWATQDSDAAFNWADALEPDLQRSAYGAIVGRMPDHELAAAGDWVRRAPVDRTMDGARTALAWRMHEEDPVSARAQITQIADPTSLERYLVPLAQTMYRNDPDNLAAWLPTSGLSQGAQQRVLGKRRN